MATKTKKSFDGETEWSFGPRNYLILGIALVVIILGYIALGQGSLTLAPVLLVVGYCIIIPIGIMVKGRPASGAPTATESSEAARQ